MVLINIDLTLISACIGIVIALIWWGLITHLVIKLLKSKLAEAKLLSNIITDIKEIKQNIRENLHQKN